jgi:hypothetical protein
MTIDSNILYIGIDPDIDKSGLCVYDRYADDKMQLFTASFFDVLQTIDEWNGRRRTIVKLEAGWLNKKSNWHGGKSNVAQKIAKNVGENHATGKLIEQYCIRNNYQYKLIVPKKSKVDAVMFKKLTGYERRTNQELRDAAMLVYGL